MKFKALIALFLLLSGSVFSQINNETPKEKEERMAWWTEARFLVCFIRGDFMPLPARHEWVMSKEQISKTDYEKYVDYFDPDLYNPNEWAN